MKAARKRVVPPEDVAIFTRRLSAAVKFGVPLVQAVEMSSEEVRNPRLKHAIQRIRDLITQGVTLSQALSKESRFFPPFYAEEVAWAEKTEDVPSALKHLAEELDDRAATRSLVRRLERYPVIASLLTVLIVLFGLFVLLPAVLVPARGFGEIWEEFDTTLPATGWGFFWGVGTFLTNYGFTIVLVLCGLAALVVLDSLLLRFFPRGDLIMERRKLKLPLYGRPAKNLNLFLFCATMGHHLKHGFPLDEALTSAHDAVRSEVFRHEIVGLTEDVRRSSTISEAMRKSEWFPFSLIHAVAAAESKGQVSQAFLSMARLYGRESEYGLNRMNRAAQAWVASVAAVSVLFCVAFFLVTIYTFFLPLHHG